MAVMEPIEARRRIQRIVEGDVVAGPWSGGRIKSGAYAGDSGNVASLDPRTPIDKVRMAFGDRKVTDFSAAALVRSRDGWNVTFDWSSYPGAVICYAEGTGHDIPIFDRPTEQFLKMPVERIRSIVDSVTNAWMAQNDPDWDIRDSQG
jgi:hypothetical protein